MDNSAPGARGLSRTQRWRYLAIIVVAALVAGLGAYFLPFLLDLATAETTARAQQQAEEAVDREAPPFTAQVTAERHATYGADFPDAWMIVLDRVLTADEQGRLARIRPGVPEFDRQVWELLQPLGARLIEIPPLGRGIPVGHAQTFQLRLFSDRTAALAVKDMRAKVDRCYAPTAQTLVRKVPEGSEALDGIIWNLAGRDEVPVITDEGGDQGQPYFTRKQINLGNGQSPGGLRVLSVVRAETCEWHIEAHYEDSAGSHPPVRITNGEKPLVTEAPPSNPRLSFTIRADLTSWACTGEIRTADCTPRSIP
ncbi:hypothetical protein [Streptomyces sp. NPDC002054]|uniref:hypothetical protein n=1 Tax=Streptomyces sp. NPDC002054 TaxID=3154663 RepID=UPI00331EC469